MWAYLQEADTDNTPQGRGKDKTKLWTPTNSGAEEFVQNCFKSREHNEPPCPQIPSFNNYQLNALFPSPLDYFEANPRHPVISSVILQCVSLINNNTSDNQNPMSLFKIINNDSLIRWIIGLLEATGRKEGDKVCWPGTMLSLQWWARWQSQSPWSQHQFLQPGLGSEGQCVPYSPSEKCLKTDLLDYFTGGFIQGVRWNWFLLQALSLIL